MFCRAGFTATGEVNLLGANIGGMLDISGATLTNPDGYALDLQELRAGVLLLRDLNEPPELVDFTHAQVGALVDAPASWPRQAVLDGFVCDALYEDRPISAHQRLGWLARNPRGYSPQPYEQLAVVYRRAGRDQDARTVAIAKQRARRRTLGLPARLWSLLVDGLVGFGYRTWLAGLWLLGFWLVGWVVFDRAHAHQELVLARRGEAHPGFHGAIYSLDTCCPWWTCASRPSGSRAAGCSVGVGVDSGRLGPHHGSGGSPEWPAQTRLAGYGVD
jgi:type IV secretory pathway TrbD component